MEVECGYCNNIFSVSKNVFYKGYGKYCSKTCHDKDQLLGDYILCKQCGKQFYAPLSQQRVGRKYCSKECAVKSVTTRIERKCLICGTLFYASKSKLEKGYGNYCSKKCSGIARTKKKLITCDNCGNQFEQFLYRIQKKTLNFCSTNCMGKYQSINRCGKNSANWKGGISFEPYCEKFNKDFRFRVREFFNNTCILCGKSSLENGRNMDVHHVNYDKSSCCSNSNKEFITLCKKCHSKTNSKRNYWEELFHNIIINKYNGKSYFTKEIDKGE